MYLASCSRSLGRLGAVELRAGSLTQAVGLRWESRGRDRLDRSRRAVSFIVSFHQGFKDFSRDCWLGPSKCPEHVLGEQMVSFLVFVEKVPADHINLNSTGPHFSAILFTRGV